MAAKKIIILTGEIQTGKTTTLFNWVKDRKDVAGVLTPVVEGKRFFYSIPGRDYYNMEAVENETEILKVGRFLFSAAQFEKTNDSILKWLNEPLWKYLIIDEIGPLELNQQKGLWSSMVNMRDLNHKPVIILVVRASLSGKVKEIFEERGFEVITTSIVGFHQFVD
jgi:nucleoside-triphosphatase